MTRGNPARMATDSLVEVSWCFVEDFNGARQLLTALQGGAQNAARKERKDKKEEKSDKKSKKPMGISAIRGFV